MMPFFSRQQQKEGSTKEQGKESREKQRRARSKKRN
jgi:hypothetical protein